MDGRGWLRLSDLDWRVELADGTALGSVADVTVRLDRARDGTVPVDRIVVADPHGCRLLSWSAVERADLRRLVVRAAEPPEPTSVRDLAPPLLRRDEVLLRRDVLDAQVIDVAGRRLRRVAEVFLGWSDPAEAPTLEAVDVGPRSLVRRLGLRRIADRLPSDVLAWPAIHMASAGGHRAQLVSTRSPIHTMSVEDLATVLHRVPVQHGAEILATSSPARVAATMATIHEDLGERVVRALPHDIASTALEHLRREHPRRASRFEEARHRHRAQPLRGRHRRRTLHRPGTDGSVRSDQGLS